jgi:hypothetical protein
MHLEKRLSGWKVLKIINKLIQRFPYVYAQNAKCQNRTTELYAFKAYRRSEFLRPLPSRRVQVNRVSRVSRYPKNLFIYEEPTNRPYGSFFD